mgnify:FL=1|jgi:hypothetical protein
MKLITITKDCSKCKRPTEVVLIGEHGNFIIGRRCEIEHKGKGCNLIDVWDKVEINETNH